jgi:two-component system cell cycle response regulator
MAENKLHLAILEQARESLDRDNLTDSERDTLLKLLDILIVALEKHAPPENLAGELHILAERLISSQALLTLATQQADELDALKILSLNLTANLDLPTVLDAVVKESMRLVNNTRIVHIFLYTNNKLEFGASLDSDGRKNRIFSHPRKGGLTETVARKGQAIIVENMKNHSLYRDAPADWSGSIVGIPLKIGEKVVGVMNLSREKTGGFSTSELRLLNMLANQAAVAISNASLHQSISKKAYTDTITGLANRRALDEHLESELINARRTNSPFAVIMMDLDGFKSVNDTYGHEVGDQVLRAVFNVVSVGIRSSDFIARYGGDELTLILTKSNLQSAKLVAEKILENIAKFSYKAPNGNAIKLGISGGIAIYPTHGRSGSDLLRAADAALYDAKRHQRGTFLVAKGITGPLDPLALSRKENGGS